jgi:hypothetical protein
MIGFSTIVPEGFVFVAALAQTFVATMLINASGCALAPLTALRSPGG